MRASRLDGLILAAPGGVTLLREDVAWWPGLKAAEATLGEAPDLEGLTRLPTAILIGAEDRAAGLVSVRRAPLSALPMPTLRGCRGRTKPAA